MTGNKKEIERLVSKSTEAFILGLEIYNKPTLRYRIEGFSLFVINAWELMLKAELLNRGRSIYYSDNPGRTISISDVIGKIYTDKNTRIRLNLEKIVELRNISAHFITEDYEVKYAPLFQACVLNFVNEIMRFHNVDITKYISHNFLTIATSYDPLSDEQIKLKYPPEVAEKLIMHGHDVDLLAKEYDSDKFSINIKQNLYITKKKDEADFKVAINKNSNTVVEIVKELKDPAETHGYSHSTIITVIQERMKKQNIKLGYTKGFNRYVLGLIIDFYNIKQEPKYSYKHIGWTKETYTYSHQFIDFIMEEIKKNPEGFVVSLNNKKR